MLSNLDAIQPQVRRDSAFALTLGGALAGAAVGGVVFGPGLSPIVMLVVLGLTGLLVSDPSWSPRRVAGWSLVGAVVALVTPPLAHALAAAPGYLLHPVHGEAVLGVLPFVIPSALAFGLLVLSLNSTMRTLSNAKTHEDGAASRVTSARWLLGVAVVSGGVAARGLDLPLAVASLLVALFAAVSWALGRDELTTRRRWLGNVRDEDAIGWRVVAASKVENLATLRLRPLIRATPLDGVLVRTGPGGPYRGGVGGTPVALVPLAAFRTVPVPATVAWREAGSVLAWLGVIALPYFSCVAAVWLLDPNGSEEIGTLLSTRRDIPLIAAAIYAPVAIALSLLTGRRRWLVWAVACVAFAATVAVFPPLP